MLTTSALTGTDKLGALDGVGLEELERCSSLVYRKRINNVKLQNIYKIFLCLITNSKLTGSLPALP